MNKLFLILLLLIAYSSDGFWEASGFNGGFFPSSGGGGSFTYSLNFSEANNSMYLGLF